MIFIYHDFRIYIVSIYSICYTLGRCSNGPNLRTYHWVADPDHPRSIYETACIIVPGEGQEARLPEWQAEIRAAGEIGLFPVV